MVTGNVNTDVSEEQIEYQIYFFNIICVKIVYLKVPSGACLFNRNCKMCGGFHNFFWW